MKSLLFAIAPALLTTSVFATPPTDPKLDTIVDRTIAKEPKYVHGKPLYVLMVFGEEASEQRWMVLDATVKGARMPGDLYIDRNGDGDFADAGEKMYTPPANPKSLKFRKVTILDEKGNETGYTVQPGTSLTRGDGELKDSLQLRIFVDTPDGDRFGVWGDQNGSLMFGSSPEEAPVISFDGPLQMGFEVLKPLTYNSESGQWRLNAGVGSYGLGAGSFAFQFQETIPAGLNPQAEIEWPAAEDGAPPERTKFALTQRC